jgi:hypothetical protein
MKQINLIVILIVVALMAGCGSKEMQTVLVGHFVSADNSPENVILYNEDTGEEFASVPVKDGMFRYDIPSDKTTIMSVRFEQDGNGWKESFVPDGDTVRYEIDGLKTVAEVFAPETSINYPTRDFARFCVEMLPRLATDSVASDEMLNYCRRLVDEHPSDFLGYDGIMFASLTKVTAEEWLELVNKLEPNIQAKPRVQALKEKYEAQRESE